MSETYKLNEAGTHIVQEREMKEPHFMDYANLKDAQKRYQFELSEYKLHIASLKTYPISGEVPPEWKGKELVEGRDFELKELWYNPIEGSDTKAKRDFAIKKNLNNG